MRNHFTCCFAALTRALAFAWLLLPASSARAIQISRIVALVDDQGRKTYINADAPASAEAVRGWWSAARRGLMGRVASQPGSDHGLRTPNSGLRGLIRHTADRFQVDPDLIHAIIEVESEYNPDARSRKGAMGLMQLIPATAQRFGVQNAFDPQQNVEGGVSYLKYLLGLFGGDLSLSLAAYNAGENSVLRQGGIPPFTETREYVKRVTSLYQPAPSYQVGEIQVGEIGRGGWVFGVRSPRSYVLTTDSGHRSANSVSAPLYRHIDANGVVHWEQ